jgi:hypothetical protein
MAFLDNAGDIILDAVLTDTGRMRLSKGDGSFRIKYFALADDEIDYTTYNSSHPNGSAYYDLDIMQTPILEAFTDNRASLKHKLMTINNRELLYLPVLRLNTELDDSVKRLSNSFGSGENFFGIAVNETTRKLNESDSSRPGNRTQGVMDGVYPPDSQTYIRIDQGFVDTAQNTGEIPSSLKDTAYLISIDDRLGSIVSYHGNDMGTMVSPEPSYVDDDSIATYFLSDRHTGDFVRNITETTNSGNTPINGRKGTMLRIKIKSHPDLADSNILFDRLGSIVTMDGSNTYRAIDSVVRIVGSVTGHRIDIPIRFFKTT